MADYSKVSVYVREESEDLLTSLGDTCNAEDVGECSILLDARYGLDGDDDVGEVLAALRAVGVPYVAADEGHYTWSPRLEVFDGEHTRTMGCDVDGNPLADSGDVASFLASDDPAAAAALFFGVWKLVRP